MSVDFNAGFVLSYKLRKHAENNRISKKIRQDLAAAGDMISFLHSYISSRSSLTLESRLQAIAEILLDLSQDLSKPNHGERVENAICRALDETRFNS